MKVKLYYNLSFELDYRVLSGRWRIETTPYPRDADLKNGSRPKGERALL
jgi:hypothetical protein